MSIYRAPEDCAILEANEIAELYPEKNPSGLRFLVDAEDKILFEFPDDWDEDKIWWTLKFANTVASELTGGSPAAI